jgi:ureidoacrylate peracid hydrolase
MHNFHIPTDVVERVTRARGKRHLFDGIEPGRAALLVVDMQNFFMEEGQPCETPEARDIVPNINRLAAAARNEGVAVVWLQMTQDRDQLQDWSVFYDFIKAGKRGLEELEFLSAGHHGHQIWPGLDVATADFKVQKLRFSAFMQGSSDLHAILQERGIDTVMLTGTLTNVCCLTTALDAMMLNYKVVMVADANAALSDQSHNAALAIVCELFGDVRTTDEVVALLAEGGTDQAAAE